MTLSEFLNVLNNNIGYVIQKSKTTGRVNEALIVRGFLLSFVDDSTPDDIDIPDFNPLAQSDDFLRRVFNGSKQLPYNDANSILNRLNAGSFNDFMPMDPTIETLKNMKKEFKCYGEKFDVKDYTYSLYLILEKILMDIVLSNQEGRIKDPRVNDLLLEVGMECPLVFKHKKDVKLIETIKEPVTNKMKMKANFFVTKIFPDSLSKDLLKEFEKVQKKPSNTNDDSNKICLCEKCARAYTVKPRLEVFEYLLNIKKEIKRTEKIRSKTTSVNLEDDINSILKSLCNMVGTDEITNLRMIPLEIKRKIYDYNIDLKKKVTEDVQDYYYIKKLFASLDEQESTFNIIATEIKLCYNKLSTVETDQNIIYYTMVDWILEQSHHDKMKYRIAGEKIVSFFVQDCEIFNEITE